MAITFEIDEDGERVALVDTVEEFEEAVNTLDCPIIASTEIAETFGIPEVSPIHSAEWDHACQVEEDRWTSLGPKTEQ